jgi:hypothetical protein
LHKDIGSGLYQQHGASIRFSWYIEIAIFPYIAPDFSLDFFFGFLWLIPLKFQGYHKSNYETQGI